MMSGGGGNAYLQEIFHFYNTTVLLYLPLLGEGGGLEVSGDFE